MTSARRAFDKWFTPEPPVAAGPYARIVWGYDRESAFTVWLAGWRAARRGKPTTKAADEASRVTMMGTVRDEVKSVKAMTCEAKCRTRKRK